jgi:hypothetical protein
VPHLHDVKQINGYVLLHRTLFLGFVCKSLVVRTGALASAAAKCDAQLQDVVALLQSNLTSSQRSKVAAAILMHLQACNVTASLAEHGVTTVTDFAWLSQLRTYLEVHLATTKS